MSHEAKVSLETFTLPSKLRIEQRLGQILKTSTMEDLGQRIVNLASQETTPTDLISDLDFIMDEFLKEKAIVPDTVMYSYVPRLISALVDKENTRNNTLDIWGELIQNKEEAVRELERLRAPKVPRRAKKQFTSQAASRKAKLLDSQ